MKKVLITGVSGGIGSATALKFIENGYFVIGTFNNGEESIKEFKNLLIKKGLSDYFFAYKCDFLDKESIDNAFRNIKKDFKYIDVLVNNAGTSLFKTINETTEKEWDNVFNVNIKSAYLTTNAVLDGMIEKKSGKIINVSSIWGVSGGSCEVCYSASKSALIGYTKALAKELAPSNINVNCVCPGVIDTKMNARLSKDDIEEIKESTPLKRIGKPSEVSELIYFLSTENASFITGQIITIDGGFIL